MFKIYDDDRECFYQWDLNQKLVVEDPTVTEVHFSNRTDGCSLVVEVHNEDGLRIANVPNILLQSDLTIRVYAYATDHTLLEKRFIINARSKPADYIYTETEVKSFEALEKRIEETYIAKQEVDTEVDTFSNNPIANYAITRYVEALNTQIISGETTVGRALQDLNGNDITLTYATKESVIPKISLWQPNTYYEVGSVVLDRDIENCFIIGVCKVAHVSGSNGSYDVSASGNWDTLNLQVQYARASTYSTYADNAHSDGNGNDIGTTYATKEEVGDISTALDNIIAIDNALLGVNE